MNLIYRDCSYYADCDLRVLQDERFETRTYTMVGPPRATTSDEPPTALQARETYARGWVRSCAASLKLHVARWGNCAGEDANSALPIDPLPASGALLAALLRAPGPLVLVGDSLIRDYFTLLACLLLPHLRVYPSMGHDAFFGKAGRALKLFTYVREAPLVIFQWWSPGTSLTAASAAVRGSSAVLFNGAAAHFETLADGLVALEDVARALLAASNDSNKAPRIAVMDYLPSHFPGDPAGEYNASRRHTYHQGSCVAHKDPAAGQTSFRRRLLGKLASKHDWPLVPLWELAAPNWKDHLKGGSPFVLEHLGGLDCRHWCNPGRTMVAVHERMLEWLHTI